MLFGNNNILNMIGINGSYDMFGMSGCNNTFGGYGNFSIFGNGFGGYSSCGNGCYGEVDYDAMAGSAVAQSLFGVLTQAASSLINTSAQNSTKNLTQQAENLSNELKSVGEQINTREANAISHAREATLYTNNAKTYMDLMKSYQSAIDADMKITANYQTNKTALETNLNAALTDEEKNAIKEQLAELEAENQKTLERIANNQAKLTEATKNFNDAMAKAKEHDTQVNAEVEAIKKLEEKKENIINEYNNICNQFDNKVLNKADGTPLNRVGTEEYNLKFDEEGNLKADAEVDKETFRKALYSYRKAETPEAKARLKKQITALWAKLPQEDKTQ